MAASMISREGPGEGARGRFGANANAPASAREDEEPKPGMDGGASSWRERLLGWRADRLAAGGGIQGDHGAAAVWAEEARWRGCDGGVDIGVLSWRDRHGDLQQLADAREIGPARAVGQEPV